MDSRRIHEVNEVDCIFVRLRTPLLDLLGYKTLAFLLVVNPAELVHEDEEISLLFEAVQRSSLEENEKRISLTTKTTMRTPLVWRRK
jgi:hypothetical protein